MPAGSAFFLHGLLAAAMFFAASAHGQDGVDWDVPDEFLLTDDMTVHSETSGRVRRNAVARAEVPDVSYDVLPLTFNEMNQYDQIAMEPYRSRYDKMSLAEKADVYGRQFEFMRNRRPNFEPGIMGAMESYQEAKNAPSSSAYEAKQFMYKPATPKQRVAPRRRPVERREQPAVAPAAEEARPPGLLDALPGPWERMPVEEPEPQYAEAEEYFEEEEYDPEPQGPQYPRDDSRMENLRRGWNARDIMRGSRQR